MYRINSTEWRGLSKFNEEMNELGVEFSKLIENKGSTDYWEGIDLRPKIIDECADVLASHIFFTENNFTKEELEYMLSRTEEKLLKYNIWKFEQ